MKSNEVIRFERELRTVRVFFDFSWLKLEVITGAMFVLMSMLVSHVSLRVIFLPCFLSFLTLMLMSQMRTRL